jgi:hypothetical protein
MVEEIKLLLPLLQGIGEGTFWLIILMYAKEMLTTLIVVGIFAYLMLRGLRAIISVNRAKQLIVDVHNKNFSRSDAYIYLDDEEILQVRRFLREHQLL